jgi:hypothetical protein
MDAPTISAFAAAAAAFFAAVVAGVQFYVGDKQSRAAMKSAEAAILTATSAGRHTVASFRQAWIDKVIDTLCEYHSIIMTHQVPVSVADRRALEALRTKLEILLNPDEKETVALLAEIDLLQEVSKMPFGAVDDTTVIAMARRLLKAEWVRIKTELK